MFGRPGALILSTVLAMTAVPAGAAEFLGAWTWTSKMRGFGGYSGIDLSRDGLRGMVLSDRAWVFGVTFERDARGVVSGIGLTPGRHLRDANGRVVTGDFADTEGLVARDDGSLAVSFENWPRVSDYADMEATAAPLPFYPAFAALSSNLGMEGLAEGPDGTLYAVVEKMRTGLPSPIFRYGPDGWGVFDVLGRVDDFSPVGADFDDRGRLYILERQFAWVGFRSRLRRLTLGANGIDTDEVLFTSQLRQHDNLEGVAIWRDPGGALRATMVSDDNFFWFQRTEFVDYRLED